MSKKDKHHRGISSYFGEMVFGPEAQSGYLSKSAIQEIHKAVNDGHAIDRSKADEVANGMKEWALEHGATHYTHWFQPLRGTTAEKHDSFFEPTGIDTGIEVFSGKALAQQEPDASSFPSGGIRNTFEARGYTAWDPSSPAFLLEKGGVRTLCIPTIFVSYTGEALDYKAPLLKTLAVVRKAATEVCKYFDEKVSDCSVSLGVEQEYFLVREDLYHQRPDLMYAGRTLIGHAPAKGQQMEDHYFGAIPTKVQAFMSDFEQKAHRLGIPLRTRHNEVAPGQFECAPQFESLNLAVDHNTLLMDIMEACASDHGFRVLLHEKPYKGINGSGKHNNWSLVTNTGVNLLSPGSSPQENLQFLTFFINVIKAVYDHADLLRASIATAANDHRLGANEAPPAIMSVFIGDTLQHVLEDFENQTSTGKKGSKTSINIPNIPEILLDNTDRNRTSPFAFTGNKFEFRAVGSSDNCASPMVVLNTIVANQLMQFKTKVDALIAKGKDKETALREVLRKDLTSCKKVIFGGNGYSDEWVVEAKKRGLKNIRHSAEALAAYMSKASVELFTNLGIFSHKELEARTEIRYESFCLTIELESKVLTEMIQNMVIPSAIRYQSRIADNVSKLLNIGLTKDQVSAQIDLLTQLSSLINSAQVLNNKLSAEVDKAMEKEHAKDRALALNSKVKPLFEEIRAVSDEIERLCDDSDWALPKYRELITLN
ncbi:MAG: glutamine synthetase III [Bacteroidia bacterium]|nr:glutamine synthetase III [Bacteroidia bacterium]